MSFLVEPQNQGRRFVSGLASKPLERILRFGLKTGGDGFLVEPQNQGGGGFPGLGHKIGGYGLVIWASKSVRRFLGLGLKTKQISVCRLCHKPTGGCDDVGHASRSSGLLHVEESLARVSQSDLKTGGGAMTGGVRGTITEVASESS
jgi:hypothetical protein